MHKKLIQELNSLAHDILKMRDKNDILAVKDKVSKLYEKINLLAYIEEYVNTTPQIKETKEELISKFVVTESLPEKNDEVPQSIVNDKVEQKEFKDEAILDVETNTEIETIKVNDTEENDDKIQVTSYEDTTYDEEQPTVVEWELSLEEQKEMARMSLEEELEDTVHADEVSNMFVKEEPRSLNDRLRSKINIGLNDRLAFVHHLFKWNQSGFNNMIKEVDQKESLEEALKYIEEYVKPNYDWSDVEQYEERLYEIIRCKFN